MVGKPNLPQGFERKPRIKGSSENAPGWDALDQERAASMADEGGKAAVEVHRKKGKAFFTAPQAHQWGWKRAAFLAGAAFFYSLAKVCHHKKKA